MGFEKVTVASYGNVTIVHLMKTPGPSKLYGIHYLVDEDRREHLD
jgi:hypothetical protein